MRITKFCICFLGGRFFNQGSSTKKIVPMSFARCGLNYHQSREISVKTMIYFKHYIVVVLGIPKSSSGVLGPALFVFGSAAIILMAAKMR